MLSPRTLILQYRLFSAAKKNSRLIKFVITGDLSSSNEHIQLL